MMAKSVDFVHGVEVAQQAYRQASSLGQVLETIDSFRPPAIDFEAAASAGVPDSLTELTASLFHARRDGSRFLSDSDWDTLDQVGASWPKFAPLSQCRILREGWPYGIPEQHSRIVLLDARTLQLPHMNGTKHHALSIARAFAAALPTDHELALFTTPRLPELASDIASLATVTWRPSLIGDVEVFVQLATVLDPNDPTNLDLLRAPWIRRITTFLDDIQGAHPAHFIGSHTHFWEHQVTVEKIRSSDIVLTLGHTSNDEAARLWDSAGPNETRPRFLITSCQSGLALSSMTHNTQASPELIVFGNHFPHKNVALVAAASSLIHHETDGNPSLTFVAGVNKVQKDEIRRLATQVSATSTADFVGIASNLSAEALSSRIMNSRGVIVPSLHEGFSLPVIEAIERNVPVALSRIPAHLELLPEGPWFFDPRSVDELVAAVVAMGEGGESWVSQQRLALAERYRPSRLDETVRDALLSVTRDGPLRKSGPSPVSIPTVIENAATIPSPVSLAHLRDQDMRVMTTLLARPRTADADAVSDVGQRTLNSVRHEHDALVAEFHRSRTWRAGRIATAPARWIRLLLGRKS
jgi:glycosyltransferase involved in cell wall biosynthesis